MLPSRALSVISAVQYNTGYRTAAAVSGAADRGVEIERASASGGAGGDDQSGRVGEGRHGGRPDRPRFAWAGEAVAGALGLGEGREAGAGVAWNREEAEKGQANADGTSSRVLGPSNWVRGQDCERDDPG
jgi:hypothetical protein